MTGFFRKGRVIFCLVFCAAIMIVVYAKFFSLALGKQPAPRVRVPVVERGAIVDRNGKQLAVQTDFFHIGVTPSKIRSPETFSLLVAGTLEMDPAEIESKIRTATNPNFTYIKKKITRTQRDELQKILSESEFADFVKFDKIPGRIYPENSLASQLIGYMGDAGRGLSGIEYSQQSVLQPEPKPGETGTIHGDNIYLTIDADLQYKLEKIAKNAMETTMAENIMLIAANAVNGEILSYVSLPSANLNAYSFADKEETIDRPAVAAYEPGSVFKIFSVASFLDAGSITPDDSFLCDGIYQRKTNLGETITIKCLDHHGWINARTALKYSCNDALAQMSERMETNTFLSYIRKFGFGERTGVELPAETRGSVKNVNDRYWSARSKPTMSIGQEISVSALQMVQAATALANGGVPIQLTVIQRITDVDGNIKYIHKPQTKERVLNAASAQYLLSCMETTAKSGTGTRAALGDISIGVKTGTAQMADTVHGGYSDTDFLSNCMAIFPIEKPEIILYIVIEKAKGETFAGRIVAPVIAEAADEIIDHLGMTRNGAASLEHSGKITIKDNAPLALVPGRPMPNFLGRPKCDIIPLLETANIKITGEGWVVAQNPQPGMPYTENTEIELTFE
ncbi:penicillin-binding protein [uncultured Treponema sp.]|uniref:penicillin-binding protein n=1 Tax=uncultured Treponema sp. TaxID=162155 RepID=UPI0027D9C7F1|nr:penicillin-binding protein [uncultured Treponema sp.]